MKRGTNYIIFTATLRIKKQMWLMLSLYFLSLFLFDFFIKAT